MSSLIYKNTEKPIVPAPGGLQTKGTDKTITNPNDPDGQTEVTSVIDWSVIWYVIAFLTYCKWVYTDNHWSESVHYWPIKIVYEL